MQLILQIWRQKNAQTQGNFKTYILNNLDPNMSVPEMLDNLNEDLLKKEEDPVAFESDCREGICGQCGFVINGDVHSPIKGTTTCLTHLRSFKDGQELFLEPFRAAAFPVKKDLVVDRSSLDRIIASGGYIGVNTGQATEANNTLIAHQLAEDAFDAASCIGCGACVATCKNASAALFTGAKVSHLSLLPQGRPEAKIRVRNMVKAMDKEGFGACSFTGACEIVCPQSISIGHIVRMNKEFWKS